MINEKTYRKALHMNVLAVAVINEAENQRDGWLGDWAAYILPVPGKNHEAEKDLWRTTGQKLPLRVAESIFPGIAEDMKTKGIHWRN